MRFDVNLDIPRQLDSEIFRLVMSWYYSGLDKFRPDRELVSVRDCERVSIKNVAPINKSGYFFERINSVAFAQLREVAWIYVTGLHRRVCYI